MVSENRGCSGIIAFDLVNEATLISNFVLRLQQQGNYLRAIGHWTAERRALELHHKLHIPGNSLA